MAKTDGSPKSSPIKAALASALAAIHFSPTEKRILQVLADGKPHAVKLMLPLLDDELSDKGHLSDHMLRIRRKIEGLGHDIVCVFRKRRMHYRYILTLEYLAMAGS